MGATIRSGERGANLDSQSGSNQEVVSVAEPDENEIKEKKENEMKECSDECRSKFRFQLFGKFYLKKMKMMKLMQSRAAKVGSWR